MIISKLYVQIELLYPSVFADEVDEAVVVIILRKLQLQKPYALIFSEESLQVLNWAYAPIKVNFEIFYRR